MHLDRRLLKLAGERRWFFAFAIGLGFAAGVFTIAQAGILSQAVQQVFLQDKTLEQVSGLLLGLLALLLCRAALVWGSELTASAAALRLKDLLRNRLLQHIQALGPAYTSGEKTGELTSAALEGVEALEPYFSQYLPSLALAVLTPLAILVVVLQVDLLSGVVFLVTAPLIPLFMVLIGSLAQTLTGRQWQTLSRLSAYFLDVLQGLTTLKIFGRSQAQIGQIGRASEQFRQTTMSVLRVTFLSALVLEMAATLSTAVVAVQIGLRLLYGRLAFEQAFFVLLLAPEFYQPLRMLGARFHSGMSGLEAAKRLFQILETPLADRTAPAQMEEAPDAPTRIRFAGVSATYGPGRPALNGVSFEIARGQQVALVGPSGSGKSTLAALLLRFIEPAQGAIWSDDCPLSDISPAAWRANVAWVPQNPYLLNDSVEANILLGRPDASREQVIWAAAQAEAHEFIQALPQGYQTPIGERGARLSGGEAQRIALARAFVKDASLIILDEATANLDPHSEARLQAGIERLLQGRTALIIAHRLNTVIQADQILVLEGGRLVQRGSHATLMQQDGLYRRMVAALKSYSPAADVNSKEVGTIDLEGAPIRQAGGEPDISESRELTPTSPARRPTWLRLLWLAASIKGWALLAALAGAATVLSGVGLMATSAYIISAAALQPSIALLQVPIVAVRFFGISRGLFRYLERNLSHQATFRLLGRLRVWFYQELEPLAPARLMAYRSGDLLARILGDIESLESFYVRALAPPLTALLALAAVFLYLMGFNMKLALLLLVFWAAAGIGLPWVIRRLSSPGGGLLIERRAALSSAVVDFIQGLADLLVFGGAESASSRVLARGQALAAVQRSQAGLNSLQVALTGLLASLGMWSALCWSIPLVSSGQIEGVYLAVLVLAALTSFEAVAPLPAAAQTMGSNVRAAERLFEVVDAEPQVLDQPDAPSPPADFCLQVRELGFRYPGGEWTLRGLSFDLPAGKRLAIVGPSGAGKTTLVNLLLRFWDYQEGQILWGGRDLREFAQEQIRRRFSLVPQRLYLFSASVRDNLRLADPQASQLELERAARLAQIHDFILSLPAGYDTWIGDQGVQLSGGERQRLAIARALLKDAPFLVLDEWPANLDALTEREISQSILTAHPGQALLVITHRLVGMEAMDEILVMDRGRVVERGRHAELLAAGGIYSQMVEIQQQLGQDQSFI